MKKTLVEFVRAAVSNGISFTRTLARIGGRSVRVAVRVVITDDAG